MELKNVKYEYNHLLKSLEEDLHESKTQNSISERDLFGLNSQEAQTERIKAKAVVSKTTQTKLPQGT